MNKFHIAAVLFALLVVAGATFAQVDDRARELLEGLAAEQDIGEVRSMEQVMTMEIADLDMSTTTRTVIDFENERAVIFTDTMGMEVVMRYVDGTTTMEMQGASMPLPPGSEGAFDGIFDEANYTGILDYPDVTATYDGIVSYADLLSGHQVTYSGGQIQSMTLGEEFADAEVRYIFGDDGRLIGTAVNMDGTDLVSVYIGEPAVNGMMLFDSEMYEVVGDVATKLATMRYETVSINEPIDETLFE